MLVLIILILICLIVLGWKALMRYTKKSVHGKILASMNRFTSIKDLAIVNKQLDYRHIDSLKHEIINSIDDIVGKYKSPLIKKRFEMIKGQILDDAETTTQDIGSYVLWILAADYHSILKTMVIADERSQGKSDDTIRKNIKDLTNRLKFGPANVWFIKSKSYIQIIVDATNVRTTKIKWDEL